MKRLLSLLLLVALLLTGCTQTASPPPSDTSTSAESTVPPETQPEHTPATGSVTVKTDYSAYTPHITQAPKYTRLSDEFITDLHPSDDYGMLYPFVGSTVSWGDVETYGLCDASGRIVVDAVYSNVHALYNKENLRYPVPLPYWVLARTVTTDDGLPETRFALASVDGSFVTDCVYTRIKASGAYIFLFTETEDALSFILLDANGETLLSSDELPFSDRLGGSPWQYACGEGVLTVCFPTGEYDVDYYYADLEGNLLCGPFHDASPFSCGYGAVIFDEGSGLVDRSGQLLRGTVYNNVSSFSNGRAIVEETDGIRYLVDTAGNYLLSSEGRGSLHECDGGYELYCDSNNPLTYYDTDGNLLFGGAIPSEWSRIGNSDMFYRYDYDRRIIPLKNMQTGEEFSLEGDYCFDLSSEEVTRIGITTSLGGGEASFLVLDSSFNELLRGEGDFMPCSDTLTGEEHFCSFEKGCLQYYDADLQPVFSITVDAQNHNGLHLFQEPSICGGRLGLITVHGFAQYDLNGNLLFYYPFISAMDD